MLSDKQLKFFKTVAETMLEETSSIGPNQHDLARIIMRLLAHIEEIKKPQRVNTEAPSKT